MLLMFIVASCLLVAFLYTFESARLRVWLKNRAALKERLNDAVADPRGGNIFKDTLANIDAAGFHLIVWYKDREGVIRCPHCHNSLQGDSLRPPKDSDDETKAASGS